MRRVFLVVAVVSFSGAWSNAWAQQDAADSLPAKSLALLPADVDIYVTDLRLREQFDIFIHSNAFAKLWSLPIVEMAKDRVHQELAPGGQLYGPLEISKMPENQQLFALLADMVSRETFLTFGDGEASSWKLMMDILSAMQSGPVMLQASGEAQGLGPNQIQLRILLETLQENSDLLRIPTGMVGWRISDDERANFQLQRLESIVRLAFIQAPELAERFERQKIGDGDFLTLNLDGSLIPWDELDLEEIEFEQGEFDELREKLEDLTLVISVGIRDDFLLFSIAESTEHLENLGEGPLLKDRDEIAKLRPYFDRRVTSISYVCEALIQTASGYQRNIDSITNSARMGLTLSGANEDDANEFLEKVESHLQEGYELLPQPGATAAVEFMTDTGYEAITYSWGTDPTLNADSPLTLLNHLGGSPLFALVRRDRQSPESVQWVADLFDLGVQGFEQFGLPNLDDEGQAQYVVISKVVYPILDEMYEVVVEKLLPALEDGQFAILADSKLKSRQWVVMAPPSNEPLPMLEPAMLIGVTDANLLREAMGDFRLLINQMLTELHELFPNEAPQFQIPEIISEEIAGGTSYFYPIPAGIVDPQLQPNAALGEHVAVVSISQNHSARLLTSSELKIADLPSDSDQDLGQVIVLNCPLFVDTLVSWADYGLDVAVQFGAIPGLDPQSPDAREIRAQVLTVAEVLKVFRGVRMETTREGDLLRTRIQSVVRDL